MTNTAQNPNSPVKRLIGHLADPVLIYTVLAMMAIMYHFHDKLVVQYGLASVVICYGLFRLFDFINTHRLIGSFCYIGACMAAFYTVGIFIEQGSRNYPISFMLWFITPQLAMDYNPWYTAAIFLLFIMFMCSVVYYFTRIRYRLFMTFLIFIIPFTIFGKDYEKVPTQFTILLTVGYIVLLFYCRQLKEGENTVIVNRRAIASAAGIYTVIFAVVASVIPKPPVTADRSTLEYFFSADAFTDKLVGKLSAFRDTATGAQFRRVNSDTTLYVALAYEPLRLKTSTFTSYNYMRDAWSASKADSQYDSVFSGAPTEISQTGSLTEALRLAAASDKEFAVKYGLSDVLPDELFTPQKRLLTIKSVFQETKAAPVPTFAEKLLNSTYKGEFGLSLTGLLYNRSSKFARDDSFTVEYSQDTYFSVEKNRLFVGAMSDDNYQELLIDALDVLDELSDEYDYDSPEFDEIWEAREVVDNEYTAYVKYISKLLDYDNNERIKKLAMEITAGLDTDYDKARAIEMYFYNNNFIYDLSYLKGETENVENFIFNTKRGVCYEYATAMTMLARAAGIPARYCEGFNLNRQRNDAQYNTNYVITTMDSHGFPELYIKGFGWMSFEPTVADVEETDTGTSAAALLYKAGLIMLAAAVLLFIGIKLYPWASHRLFLIICRRRSANKTAESAMHRVCRIYGISAVNTSDEVRLIVLEASGADISAIVRTFDRAVYGEETLAENEKDIILGAYINAYTALRETKKKNRKKKTRRNTAET